MPDNLGTKVLLHIEAGKAKLAQVAEAGRN
jgi:hypothetical protein